MGSIGGSTRVKLLRKDAASSVPFHRVQITRRERAAVNRILRSGWLTQGPECKRLEEELAHFVGVEDMITTSSGTAALHLMLVAHGIGPGDEVLVPTWTFASTVSTVLQTGATPRLVDVDPVSLNVTPEIISANIGPSTRAVLVVHFAGVPVDIEAIRLAVGEDLLIFEDAAHALPASTDGRNVGSGSSDAAAFSFYATKTVTSGEGGALHVRNPQVQERARRLRLHGMSTSAAQRYSGGSWRYDIEERGFKYNMSDLAASLARVQLQTSVERRNQRASIAGRYDTIFAHAPQIEGPYRAPASETSWHIYCIRVTSESRASRDEIIAFLRSRNIGTSVHFIPLHHLTAYRHLARDRRGTMRHADQQFERVLSLPIWSGMSPRQVDYVGRTLLEATGGNR